jgi:hypothetical protein
MLDSDENIQKFLDSIGKEEILGLGVQWSRRENQEHKIIKRVPQLISSDMKPDYLSITFAYIVGDIAANLVLRFVFGKGWELEHHKVFGRSRNAS